MSRNSLLDSWLCVSIISSISFRVNPHSVVPRNVKELLAPSRCHMWNSCRRNEIRTQNYFVRKRTSKPFSQTGKISELCCEYLSVRCIWPYVIIMPRTSFGVDRHSIVYLNFKELFARSRCHSWSLSDSNQIWTHNHSVGERRVKNLTKLTNLLSCVVGNYLCRSFDCMLLSCHVRVSEWIHTL